jgi:hypothetical protein
MFKKTMSWVREAKGVAGANALFAACRGARQFFDEHSNDNNAVSCCRDDLYLRFRVLSATGDAERLSMLAESQPGVLAWDFRIYAKRAFGDIARSLPAGISMSDPHHTDRQTDCPRADPVLASPGNRGDRIFFRAFWARPPPGHRPVRGPVARGRPPSYCQRRKQRKWEDAEACMAS